MPFAAHGLPTLAPVRCWLHARSTGKAEVLLCRVVVHALAPRHVRLQPPSARIVANLLRRWADGGLAYGGGHGGGGGEEPAEEEEDAGGDWQLQCDALGALAALARDNLGQVGAGLRCLRGVTGARGWVCGPAASSGAGAS